MSCSKRTDQLLECFKAIILQDKDVIEILRECEKRLGVGIYTSPLTFYVPWINNQQSCDCWFEHEYFDYLQNGKCHQIMFETVCSNINTGNCEHMGKENSRYGKPVMVYLIHAAVATNDRTVTKYISRQILKRSRASLDTLATGFTSLTAEHIAVVKGSRDVIQYVTEKYVGKNRDNFDSFLRHVGCMLKPKPVLAKRNGRTGKIEMTTFRHNNVLMTLLTLYRTPFPPNTLRRLFPVLGLWHLNEFMHIYLSKRENELALILLNDRITADMCPDSSILINAIFMHAHDLIKIWIRQGQSLSVEIGGTKIEALFMAKALGCRECISLVRRGMEKDRRMQHKNSFNNIDISPYILACGFAKRFEYDTDIMQNILKDLHYKGSCNLNQRYSSSETVLHVLAKSDFFNNDALECLLDLGSDVNASDDSGSTPLQVILKTSNYNVEAVKCLLEHGADVNHADLNGQTPFMTILQEAKGRLVHVVRCFGCLPLGVRRLSGESRFRKNHSTGTLRCLKYFLYFNPSLDIHADILSHVKNIYQFYYFDGYVNLPIVPTDRNSSLFAVLLELGFMNIQTEELVGPILDYYRQFTSQPRSLKSCCRVGIRHAFPGYQLHKLLKLIQIPKILQEYILFKDVLFFDD